MEIPSAHDIAAFGIIDCNVSMPYDLFMSLCAEDDFYQALMRRYELKEKREDYRTALICCTMANSMGAKSRIDDFLPKKPMSKSEMAKTLELELIKYNDWMKQSN